jgi:hypothetical protein
MTAFVRAEIVNLKCEAMAINHGSCLRKHDLECLGDMLPALCLRRLGAHGQCQLSRLFGSGVNDMYYYDKRKPG